MKKNKFLTTVSIVFLAIATLTSCQLAKEDLTFDNKDSFIGFYITDEELEFESSENDEDNLKINASGELVYKDDTDIFEISKNRIYADIVYDTYTNSETGEKCEIGEYVFEDLRGVPLFSPNTSSKDIEFTNSTTGASDLHFGGSDTKDSLSGTVYMIPEERNIVYFNKVYQDSEGKVYVVNGQVNSVGGSKEHLGTLMSKVEESKKTTVNGITKEKSFEVEAKVTFKYPDVELEIVQMADNNQSIQSVDFKVADLPEDFKVDSETAYILVKETKSDGTEEIEIYDKTETAMVYFIESDTGFLEQKSVNILWDK